MNHIDAAFEKHLRDAFEEDQREREAGQRMQAYVGGCILLLSLLLGYALGFGHAHYIHQHDLSEGYRLGRIQGQKDVTLRAAQ
jgi:hypothetical protein